MGRFEIGSSLETVTGQKQTMREKIEILINLQQVESEATGIRDMLAGLPEKIDALNEKRREFEEVISEKAGLIEELSKTYRSYEDDVKANQAQVDKSREKLASVKTNKEYQSSLKEIDDLKAINSKIEDEMLECLEKMDAAEAVLKDKKDEFEGLSEVLAAQKKELESKAEMGKKRLDQLEQEERQIADLAPSELLVIFNNVKSKQAKGLAIVPVSDAKCHGCHVNLPPQMYNELQKGDKLQFCPNCQRIVYWKQE